MIPKIIHFIWFGRNPLPELAVHCIDSWKKYCPDYKIIEWNEDNFDVMECDYIREAYEAKRWAFVSDYARLKVLYEHGGIYMDTDVELVAPIDAYLSEKAFSGFESDTSISTGIMACEKKHSLFKQLLDFYTGKHFFHADGTCNLTTNVTIITNIMLQHGIELNNTKQTVCDMTFYPKDFFCPKDEATGISKITKNTVCIHHFDGSWHTPKEKRINAARQYCNVHFGPFSKHAFRMYKLFFAPELIIHGIKKRIYKEQ